MGYQEYLDLKIFGLETNDASLQRKYCQIPCKALSIVTRNQVTLQPEKAGHSSSMNA